MLPELATHECRPFRPERVARAESAGYVETFHTNASRMAEARSAVLIRAGFATIIEEVEGGYIVLARATEAAAALYEEQAA